MFSLLISSFVVLNNSELLLSTSLEIKWFYPLTIMPFMSWLWRRAIVLFGFVVISISLFVGSYCITPSLGGHLQILYVYTKSGRQNGNGKFVGAVIREE